MPLTTDLEIARSVPLRPIAEIAHKLGLPDEQWLPYGRHKAKITPEAMVSLAGRQDGKLILVTAISPTPPGEGKTTTSVGLGDALNRIGRKTVICLREPSIGPVFGMKGGATGGGRSQVVPMEDINFHFTGDFHAIQLANNLLAALIDNHIYHGNELGFDLRRITWKRVLDMNDRALREIVVSLGGAGNGYPRQDGFDIVVASEVMAIFCLAESLDDLQIRLGDIVIGYSREHRPILARELGAQGSMTALLRDALMPNLVQTLEGNPALIHGGPFANIAHGCNSVMATRLGLKLGDYVVTEAGFGADLGAEKFLSIKCRKAGLNPAAAVIVATIRALKYHGGADSKSLEREDLSSLRAGAVNLERHVDNVRLQYGLPCVVALNHFTSDSAAEVALLRERMDKHRVSVVVSRHWAEGGAGAEDLARAVVKLTDGPVGAFTPLYEDALPLWEKFRAVATRIHGAADITADPKIREQIRKYQDGGFGHLPICIAKTQYSFSTDPFLRGAPSGHVINVREVRLAAGAGFVIFICGDILTMPGLPKAPSAFRIGVDGAGQITGLS